MSGLNIAIVGATGQIGHVVQTFLTERGFPVKTIRFFSSSRSSGITSEWKGQHTTVEDVTTSDFSGIDIIVFSTGASTSREYAPKSAAQNAVVVDNSSVWRRDPEVPLVVSGIDPEDVAKRPKGIITNPNCTTVAAMPMLRPLVDKANDLEHLFVSSYQAASGSGIKDVQGLVSQTRSGVNQDPAALALDGRAIILPEPEVYVALTTFDVALLAGPVVEDGSKGTDKERKLRNKSCEILHTSDLRTSGTHVRIPIFTGHALAIRARFSGAITANEARRVLTSAPSVRLVEVPTPLEATGRDEILCDRIRQDQAVEGNRGLVLVLNGDNLRKSAALNTIQVAGVVVEELLGRTPQSRVRAPRPVRGSNF